MLLERTCKDKEQQVKEKQQYIRDRNEALALEEVKLQNQEEDLDEET